MRCFLWLLPLGAARSLRVALQVSGHLRSMCANESHFEAFASMVDDCRRVLDCDVFLHTWSTTEATTSTWHDRDPPAATPSTPCVARLDARLGFAASAVEDQRVAEGQWRRLAKRGWLDPKAPVRFADTGQSYQGLRGLTHAAVAADALRARSDMPYDVAARLRPDVWQRDGDRYSGVVDIDHLTRADFAALAAAAGARRSGRGVLHGCGRDVPGKRNRDNCFWAQPATLTAALASWNATMAAFIAAQRCVVGWAHSRPPGEVVVANLTREEPCPRHAPISAALALTSTPGETALAIALRSADIAAVAFCGDARQVPNRDPYVVVI